jgi:hypothetical protein
LLKIPMIFSFLENQSIKIRSKVGNRWSYLEKLTKADRRGAYAGGAPVSIRAAITVPHASRMPRIIAARPGL